METTGGGSNTTSYTYDASGRQTTSSNVWSVQWGCGGPEGCETAGANGDRTRAYDAQNHLIGDTISEFSPSAVSGCVADRVDPPHEDIAGVSETLTYEWGPNGHPDRWSGGGSPGFNTPLTLHWDGDTPLFITDGNGTLDEIKIEGIGFYAPSASTPMTFLDRNQAGFVVASHTSSGPGLWTAASPFHQTCDGVGVSGYALFEPGPDGVTDTVNTIQGVRSYDPAMGTWTTPDAYAGDASDPMSKKSYMWNRNNAFAYSDPTGYCSNPGSSGTAVCIDFYISVKSVGLDGNERGPQGNAKTSADTYKVQILIDFAKKKAQHTVSHSYFHGHDLGQGHDQGTSVTFSGKTAMVHVAASCAPCLNYPRIHADLAVTENANGSVSISGTAGKFPAIEAYAYRGSGSARAILNVPESGSPLGLFQSQNISGTSSP